MVVSAVPNPNYKVKTEWLKDGCICVNVAADKNFEKDVREKVPYSLMLLGYVGLTDDLPGIDVPACGGQSDHPHASSKLVGSFICHNSQRTDL